jgi:hypothetical protein
MDAHGSRHGWHHGHPSEYGGGPDGPVDLGSSGGTEPLRPGSRPGRPSPGGPSPALVAVLGVLALGLLMFFLVVR